MANGTTQAPIDGRVSTASRSTSKAELIGLSTIFHISRSVLDPGHQLHRLCGVRRGRGIGGTTSEWRVPTAVSVQCFWINWRTLNNVVSLPARFICHNALFGLTTYSLFLTSTRSPGSPSRSYSHQPDGSTGYPPGPEMNEDERDAMEADFRGISVDEWKASKPRPSTHNKHDQYERQDLEEDEDDVPLVNLLPKSSSQAEPVDPAAIPALTVKGSSGGVRWCRKCNAIKPDRCHHCSTCGRCQLMMGTSLSGTAVALI
jgi:hypothetical protein